MQYLPKRGVGGPGRFWLGALVLASALATAAPAVKSAPHVREQPWRQIVERITHNEFEGPVEAVRRLYERRELGDEVRGWLEEFEAKEAQRRRFNEEDFAKYVGYAKARMERGEFRRALSWALAALDCTADRESFVKRDWVVELANRALAKAEEYRDEGEWLKAWHLYTRLGALFEREPQYKKLQREAATHLRLDSMFKQGSHWRERVENVRWQDAERALEYVERYYVERVDFREIAETGLEQLLVLCESQTAREEFPSLASDHDREEFTLRVQEHLAQVREASSVDAAQCARHFKRVVKAVNEQTVRLSEELLVAELMRGALEPLDDFTTIIWPQDTDEFDKHTRGDFVGVGISIVKNSAEEIEVVTPLEDTPAYRAGIQAGDVITAVDGEPIKGFSISKVVRTITGPEDTPVTLTIRRDAKEFEFPLVREKVRIRSIKGIARDPVDEERWDHWLDRQRGIAYVRITNFQKNTVEDLVNLLSELTAGGLKGLILDLRANPGGLLDSAWQITSLFLKSRDVVVSTKGRIKREDNVFRSPGDGAYADVPLVVLVDDRSASASEIVSGAIRDNGHGIVVGERTFGKFSVQNLLPLGRSGAKLKVTTSRYYLPKGDSLHRAPDADTWGVTPDIPVRLVQKEKQNVWQMQREANLLGPPKPKSEDTTDSEAAEKDDESPSQGKADEASDDRSGDQEAGEQVSDPPDGEPAAEGEDPPDPDEADDEDEESGLPPLEQPDENNRPEEDPQLDAALLMMRVLVTSDTSPALATAEPDDKSRKERAAKP